MLFHSCLDVGHMSPRLYVSDGHLLSSGERLSLLGLVSVLRKTRCRDLVGGTEFDPKNSTDDHLSLSLSLGLRASVPGSFSTGHAGALPKLKLYTGFCSSIQQTCLSSSSHPACLALCLRKHRQTWVQHLALILLVVSMKIHCLYLNFGALICKWSYRWGGDW